MNKQKANGLLGTETEAAIQRQIDRMTPLDEATRETILARLRGLKKEYVDQFWRAWRCKSVSAFSKMELPAIRQILHSLELQQSGRSVFDIHKDGAGDDNQR